MLKIIRILTQWNCAVIKMLMIKILNLKFVITLAGHENLCVCSYAICVVLTVIALAISIGISAYFAYSHWYFKKDITRIKFGTCTEWNCIQTTIY